VSLVGWVFITNRHLRLTGVRIDAIITSPLLRCVETAIRIAEQLDSMECDHHLPITAAYPTIITDNTNTNTNTNTNIDIKSQTGGAVNGLIDSKYHRVYVEPGLCEYMREVSDIMATLQKNKVISQSNPVGRLSPARMIFNQQSNDDDHNDSSHSLQLPSSGPVLHHSATASPIVRRLFPDATQSLTTGVSTSVANASIAVSSASTPLASIDVPAAPSLTPTPTATPPAPPPLAPPLAPPLSLPVSHSSPVLALSRSSPNRIPRSHVPHVVQPLPPSANPTPTVPSSLSISVPSRRPLFYTATELHTMFPRIVSALNCCQIPSLSYELITIGVR
jgi:hypothetical protein